MLDLLFIVALVLALVYFHWCLGQLAQARRELAALVKIALRAGVNPLAADNVAPIETLRVLRALRKEG